MSLRGRRHGGGRKNELIFLTTCGPSTTFDPKITGVDGVWFFDDGTTLAATSGVEISKTFAAEGLHRAIFRPASGGLAAITAIDSSTDLLTSVVGLRRCALSGDAWFYTNTALVIDIADLSKSNRPIVTTCPYVYGQLSTTNRAAIGIKYAGTAVTGSLADLPATLASFCWLYSCAGVRAASIAHLKVIQDIRIYNMGWTADDVDLVIDSIYQAVVADANHFTYASPALQIGGSGGTANAAPSGVYQEATPPTTGLEKVYYLTHLAAHTWAITWNGGSGP